MLGLSGKTKHFQLNHIPKKSTLSDANKRRDADVFGDIYNKLLKKYGHFISDSRIKDVINKQIEIIDSSIISLFKDILKCVGRNPENGKKKGGIKLHTVINVDEAVPKMLWFSSAATHDHSLLDKLKPDSTAIPQEVIFIERLFGIETAGHSFASQLLAGCFYHYDLKNHLLLLLLGFVLNV